jgi:hypothetical protein
LSTIATPHHGSPIADQLVGAQPAVKDPRRFAYDVISRALSHLGVSFGALGDLTTGFAEQFNQDSPKLDHVHYFSYAGSGNGSFLLARTHTYIESCGNTAEEKINDGLVSTSADTQGFGVTTEGEHILRKLARCPVRTAVADRSPW